MATLPDPPNPTMRVNLHWLIGSDTTCITRLYFKYATGGATSADIHTWLNLIGGNFETDFGPLVGSWANLTAVEGIDITTHSGNSYLVTTGMGGGRTGGALAPATATLLNHHISRRYRGGKPRSYFPFGVSSDMQNTGLWTSAFTGAVQTAWNTWIASVIASSVGSSAIVAQVNLSYQNAHAPRVTPVEDTINSSTVNPKPGSQRRRNLH